MNFGEPTGIEAPEAPEIPETPELNGHSEHQIKMESIPLGGMNIEGYQTLNSGIPEYDLDNTGPPRNMDMELQNKNGKEGSDGELGSPRVGSRSASRGSSKSRSPSHSRSRSKSRSRTKSRSPSKKRYRTRSRSSSLSPSKSRYSSKRKSRRSRSRSPIRRRSRGSSSSSRDTYDTFKASSPPRGSGEFQCRKCDRSDFESIRELSEHEIRAHGARFPCPHCDKEASTVQKLVDHMKQRHPDLRIVCDYCKDDFGSKASSAKDSKWEDFRSHVYKECLKEKMYSHERSRGRWSGAIAQRGRGRCPHGPPVKCKNFPRCPGVKCYYFHGYCRYDVNCVKKECPFDHSDRPRVCLSCLRDHRIFASRERRSSRK